MSLVVEIELSSDYAEIHACRGCLATDTELHDLNNSNSAQYFSELTGLSVRQSDGYPQFVCSTCLFLLRKFVRFRRKCLTAIQALQQMKLSGDNVTTDHIKSLDRTHIKHDYQKHNAIDINIIAKSDVSKFLNGIHRKLDNILKGKPYDDNTKIENRKRAFQKAVRPKIEDAVTKIPEDGVSEKLLTIKQERIDSVNSVSVDNYNALEDNKPMYSMTKEDKPITLKQEGLEITEQHVDTVDRLTVNNANTFEYYKPMYSIKIERDDEVNNEIDERTDKEHTKFDKSFTINVLEKESKLPTIKEERPKALKKKAVKRTMKDIGDKLVKEEGKPRKKVTKEIDEGHFELNDVWKKIIEEIKDEASNNKAAKRKVPSKAYIQCTLRKAKKFATINNVELKFLTKEEQKIEIEEKRNSEKFRKAPYKCDKCCKVFNSEETFANHSLLHSGGEFTCEICQYSFRTRRKWFKHFDLMHVRKMTCKDCGQINRTWGTAREHYLWHQGTDSNIGCEQCGLQFALRKKYLSHVRNTHGGGVSGPQCLLCDRAFYNQKGLQHHLIRMHKDKPRCSSCSVVFASADALGAHVNAPQGCQPGRSCCPKCGNNYTSESEMKTHYNEEHKKNCYKCETCGKLFSNLMKYNGHRVNHTRGPRDAGRLNRGRSQETSRVVCEVCGVETANVTLLREHQRIHTGEKPFHCTYCPKTFRLKLSLKMHTATHTGEKKYECPICHKVFRQYQHRTGHMVTHTKERPYACTACPKRYPQAPSLREHVNTAHLGLPPRKRVKKDPD